LKILEEYSIIKEQTVTKQYFKGVVRMSGSKVQKSRKERVISAIKGQQSLGLRNGKGEACYVKLETLYKVLRTETVGEKAEIRGVLNHDFINGSKIFERKAVEGKKRSGEYRLRITPVQAIETVQTTEAIQNIETVETIATIAGEAA
jgi:hypothetical protein